MTDPLLLPGADDLSRSLYELERIFASSAAFRTLVGAATIAAAKDKIHFKEATGTEARPFACASLVNPLRYGLKAGGDQNYLRPNGEALLYVAADPPAEVLAAASPKKAELMWAAKTFGLIAKEVAELAGQDQTADTDVVDSHLGILTLTVLDFSCTPEELWRNFGRWWWCVYSASWGDEG